MSTHMAILQTDHNRLKSVTKLSRRDPDKLSRSLFHQCDGKSGRHLNRPHNGCIVKSVQIPFLTPGNGHYPKLPPKNHPDRQLPQQLWAPQRYSTWSAFGRPLNEPTYYQGLRLLSCLGQSVPSPSPRPAFSASPW